MKTIYISIYKERHRKIGNGSIPPETAGESGRQSSTARGKQDQDPALLLGYTFVYGNHISQSGARAGRDNGRRPVWGSFPWCSAQPPRQRGRQAIFDMLEAKAKKR